MTKRVLLTIALLALSGCAKVSVLPLDAKGQPLAGAQEGVRYYLPKPYLLVAEVPVDKVSSSKSTTKKTVSTTRKKAPAGESSGDQNAPVPSGGSGDAPSATGNTSFAIYTMQYGIKLIYLPDFEHPMSISESPGLFGSSTMKPALQDGWMLTSLEASADIKVAETLNAIGSIVSGIKGGGATASSLTKQLTCEEPPKLPVLPPGLYEFMYDREGKFHRLRAVAYFCHDGIQYTVTGTETAPRPCP